MRINFYKVFKDFLNCRKEMALIEAAKWGNKNKLQQLLAQGVNPNVIDENGKTPLAWTAYSQNNINANLLLTHGADPNCFAVGDANGTYTILMQGAKNGNFSLVKDLIAHGVDLNKEQGIKSLFYAIDHGIYAPENSEYFEIAKALLSAGVNPNIGLVMAAQKDRIDYLDLLLTHGADPNIEDGLGRLALSVAAQYCHQKACELLLKYGADPTKKDKYGLDALDYARSHSEIAEILTQDKSKLAEIYPNSPDPQKSLDNFFERNNRLIAFLEQAVQDAQPQPCC